MKKAWEAPKLIVIVRSSPEESLISLCKGGTDDGAVTMDRACQVGYDGCMTCQQMSNS